MSTPAETIQSLGTSQSTPPDETTIRKSRVQLAIESQFRVSPYRELRKVACDFNDGSAVLHGKVTSFHLKQIATRMLQQVEGVKHISNLLSVHPLLPRPR